MYLLRHWLQYGYMIVSFENKNTNFSNFILLIKGYFDFGGSFEIPYEF